MKLTRKRIINTVLVVVLLIIVAGTLTACEDLGFPTTTSSPENSESGTNKTDLKTFSTADAAILAVYRRLLTQADSYDARVYLADFYATCDNWSAEAEYFKDGSDTWHVVLDMTDEQGKDMRAYWRQASWWVFRDGSVIPSNLFEANALRIEADLQALCPGAETEEE